MNVLPWRELAAYILAAVVLITPMHLSAAASIFASICVPIDVCRSRRSREKLTPRVSRCVCIEPRVFAIC